MTSFFGDEGAEVCAATTNESVTGGTRRAYLLYSSDNLIADDTSATLCSGVTKLLRVIQLDTKVNITASTTSVKTTFKVRDNGATVIHDDGTDGIQFD